MTSLCATCSDPTCVSKYEHPVCQCGGSNVHSNGKRYQTRASTRNNVVQCVICRRNPVSQSLDVDTTTPKDAPSDLKGRLITADTPGPKFCELCHTRVPLHLWGKHNFTPYHKSQEQYAAFRAVVKEAERDKYGVMIEGSFDFDIIDLTTARNGSILQPTIKVTLPRSRISLVQILLVSAQHSRFVSPFSVTTGGSSSVVASGTPVVLRVQFRQSRVGRYDDRVEFLFEDVHLRRRFSISRALRAIIGDKADYELLQPKAPYVPKERVERQPELTIVEGVVPPSLKAIPYVVRLPEAYIPGALILTLSNGSASEAVDRVRKGYLPPVLDSKTYASHFKHLLWVEEYRMDRDIERYDMTGVKLSRHLSYFYLEIPGLAEKRPSVLVGDRILVQKEGAAQGHWFEGGVHVLRKEEVGLRFHRSFSWTSSQRYNVRFKLNRIPMRRQHQAMESPFSEPRVLFPAKEHVSPGSYPTITEKRLKLVNPLVAKNPPQLQAVISIVSQPAGAVPFVLFGPPGTGKTITIVEAMQQVLLANPNSRILACVPSNSAADIIASRLNNLTPNEMFRFYAPTRSRNQVPDNLSPFTYVRNDGHFSVPPLERMKQFRVVVTTCVSASVIAGIGLPPGHYSHIFVDEAGHATEPEVFVSVKTIANHSTNVILSGDPKQLGPIIRSDVARGLGLEKSYIERLMERDVYDIKTGYGKSVIKLVKNFRSHDAILKFPNKNFYNGDLEPCGNPSIIDSFLGSPFLPSKQFPIVFHGISGKDDREASSPSFFNIDEVSQVKAYVQALRADRRLRVTDHDIGIITPYHAQCLKIRAVLRAVADDIKIGSVEEFQGQERRVIIISTVRSSKEFIEYDLRHTLGFVASPRRFNVAVTRAQALLIIIGDSQVLSLDPLWRSFLNYVHSNNGWTGQPPSWDTNAPINPQGGYDRLIREEAQVDMNDFSRRLEALTISGALDEDAEALEAQVDRPWRDME